MGLDSKGEGMNTAEIIGGVVGILSIIAGLIAVGKYLSDIRSDTRDMLTKFNGFVALTNERHNQLHKALEEMQRKHDSISISSIEISARLQHALNACEKLEEIAGNHEHRLTTIESQHRMNHQ